MGHYRIYQLDPSDHIATGFSVECGSDAAAMHAARNLLERSAGVEVWKNNHLVAHLSVVVFDTAIFMRPGARGTHLGQGLSPETGYVDADQHAILFYPCRRGGPYVF